MPAARHEEPSAAALEAVAGLYHRYFTGLILTVASRRSGVDAGELVFRTFRHQHHEKFLPGLEKLRLSHLPDAVASAGYHYLANRIGGVKVEFMRESDRKAWVRFVPPRWVYEGPAICAVPGEVSRGFLRGWYAQNGVSLGNPRLGFVCTAQTMDGQHGLAGYFLEHDRDLSPEERLRFSPGEEPPPFVAEDVPRLDESLWTAERLRKANRNYAMEYVRSMLPRMAELFGPAEAAHLGNITGRLIGMQHYDETAGQLGVEGDDPEAFCRLMVEFAAAEGDACEWSAEPGGVYTVRRSGWRLFRGVEHVPAAAFDAWNGLWEGAIMVHNRFLLLDVVRRLDHGDDCFEWRIRPRRPSRI